MTDVIELIRQILTSDMPGTLALIVFLYKFVIPNFDRRLDKLETAINGVSKTFSSARTPCDKPLASSGGPE